MSFSASSWSQNLAGRPRDMNGRGVDDEKYISIVPFKPSDTEGGNKICTSKYRWYNFVPKNLYEQFQNLANVYFLVIMLLQTVKAISITNGKPTIGLPLSIVIVTGAIKDLWEDNKRKQADDEENMSQVEVLQGAKEGRIQRLVDSPSQVMTWQELRPGHVVRLRADDRVPADLLLLESSEESGSCKIETMSLDGETNFKQKACALPEKFQWASNISTKFRLNCSAPTADLYTFRGALAMPFGEEENNSGVSMSNLLLRGSSVQQTEWVVGMAVYCGHESRVMKNAEKPRFKLSTLDMDMNRLIFIIFVLEIVTCVCAACGGLAWEYQQWGEGAWYLLYREHDETADARHCLSVLRGVGVIVDPHTFCTEWSKFLRIIVFVGTWLITISNMVPISLVIILTCVKIMQGRVIEADPKMVTDCQNAEVHCSQVLETLGQVTHIFSDKTGTLTCNEMRYTACSVNEKMYGWADQDDEGVLSRQSTSQTDSLDFVDPAVSFSGKGELLQDMARAVEKNAEVVIYFLLCHAICHTVTAEQGVSDMLKYWADSPDELALVSASRMIGLEFREAHDQKTVLHVTDQRLDRALQIACGSTGIASQSSNDSRFCRRHEFELLDINDFDNDRKCMSVVVRLPNKKILLLMKGADSSVLPVVGNSSSQDKTEVHLKKFSRKGLRTLVMAYRELGKQEYENWSVRHQAALSSLDEDRADRVHKIALEIETQGQARLLGATAVEDRLQKYVPETIKLLRDAQICVWVLTGDKMETAINIGRMCRLLDDDLINVEILNVETLDEQLEQLEQTREMENAEDSESDAERSRYALTISGIALNDILATKESTKTFCRLANMCASVLCCRVSPKQKAEVVDAVKRYSEEISGDEPVTLAIGDGANDVSMITTAHVGIGLSGKEGAQAARAADFAFAEFRFLHRLLFRHGLEAYRRNSTLVCYNFYKNLLLVGPMLVYGFMMAFSGQPFYEQMLFQLFNVFFTCVPIVLYALLDKQNFDFNDDVALTAAYEPGRNRQYFNCKVFCLWMAAGVLQAISLSITAFILLGRGTRAVGGLVSGEIWELGACIFFWVVLLANVTIFLRMNIWPPLTMIAIFVSVISHPIFSYLMFELATVTGKEADVRMRLQELLDFMFSARGFLRFLAATGIAVALHVLFGEPLLWMSEPSKPTQVKKEHPQASSREPTPQSVSSALERKETLGRLERLETFGDRSNFAFDKEDARVRRKSIDQGPINMKAFSPYVRESPFSSESSDASVSLLTGSERTGTPSSDGEVRCLSACDRQRCCRRKTRGCT